MARLLMRLATVEWTQAGRCFRSLMRLPNESFDITKGHGPVKDNIPGATRVNWPNATACYCAGPVPFVR